ncbi:MAG: undecaprenyl-phosphate glucose phosphotransferase [Rhizobiales bacterium]|nr:undecaprenyl-phosphate glucose phosphotransferase [Hyphomicrobiales bacterium]
MFSSHASAIREALETVDHDAGLEGARRTAPKWSRKVAADLLAWSDVAVVLMALVASLGIAGLFAGLGFTLPEVKVNLFGAAQTAIITAIAVHVVLRRFDRYNLRHVERWCQRRALAELLPVIGAFGFVVLVGAGLGTEPHVPVTWYPLWALITVAGLFVVTMVGRRVLGDAVERGRFSTRVAIYGSGRIARRLVGELERVGTEYEIAGIFDDRLQGPRADTEGLQMAGTFDDLIAAGRRDEFDSVLIALPADADRRVATMALRCEQLPVDIDVCTHFTNDFLRDNVAHRGVSRLGNIGLLSVRNRPLRDWASLIKRAEDAILAPLLLVVASPILLVAAIAVRLDSPGPILFRQMRHGLNHREIEVLKFRTMTVTENGPDVRQATRNDPRVTRVGRFLRRTSIDELPQLVNVLRGDMSLVGPRPHAISHNEEYSAMLERYSNRHNVKPGITGWAQVNGYRGETRTPEDMANRIRYDLEYIDNWSILFDLKILAMTPFYGIVGRNAY